MLLVDDDDDAVTAFIDDNKHQPTIRKEREREKKHELRDDWQSYFGLSM